MPKKCWNGWSWTFSLSQVPWLPTVPTLGFQAVKASTTRFLDFGSGFKESELHSGRKGFEIPIEILLKSQSLEANVLQRPLLSSGKNVDDVLGTFGDLGMAWVAKKWPEKATRDQKRQKREANSIQCSQAVTHPSTDWTQHCLTSVIGRELVCSM